MRTRRPSRVRNEWWDPSPNQERGTPADLKKKPYTVVPAGPKVVAFSCEDVGRADLIRGVPETRGAPAEARAPWAVGIQDVPFPGTVVRSVPSRCAHEAGGGITDPSRSAASRP